ncbi:MAG TPA: DUF2079 domain-containing protein [Patescibacteria group bacterium]|nr:DUF2079 domain-containing protein [Patescibacteria group bacterium]
MKHFFTTIKFLIGWPLSLVALFFVGKALIGKGAVITQIHSLNILPLVMSLGCFIAFFVLRVLFWQKILAYQKMHFSFKETALTWGFSELKRYIPGTIWPILGRSSAYEKLGAEKKAILASILHEAEFLGVACLTITIFSLNFLYYGILGQHNVLIPSLIGIVIGIVALIFVFHKPLLKKNSGIFRLLPNFPPKQMLSLFGIMISAFLLFGLATYFAIDAIVPLFIPHILPLSAFFVFAFLAGYLSFLAPMGLGVREGIVTIGLTKYVSLSESALGALFSRVIQILSELLFLLLCVVWKKVSAKTKKVEQFILAYKYELATLFTSCCYTVYFSIASILRYNNFFTGRFDLGNMDQTVWNTIHGRLFQLTDPNGTSIVSRLAFHADFTLIFLSPFYLIWQDPRMLLLLQSLALGLGGIFVYLIAQNVLNKKSLSFAFALSYYLYPAIAYANLYDFHTVTLAVCLFLASWYTMLKKKYFIATILLLLAATTKEEVWFITGLFGLFFIFWKKQYILGTLLSLVSFSLFYLLIWHAIPFFHGGAHFALSYYSDFGTSPSAVVANILLSPLKIIMDVLRKGQLVYLFELFGPLFFLPLFALPFLIFAFPDLAISLLSQNAQLHTIYYHYAAIPTPFLFLAAVYGFARLAKKFPQFFGSFGMLIILVPAVVSAYAFGPLPGAYHMSDAMFVSQLPYARLIDTFLLSIPRKYSVAATNNVGSHLSHRQKIFTIPVGLQDADIVVFLLDDSYAQPSLKDQKKMAQELDKNPAYIKLFSYQDFVVYKKKSVPTYYKKHNTNILPLFKGN